MFAASTSERGVVTANVQRTKERIASETPFAIAVFRTIYSRQKPRERNLREHIGHDGQGFQAIETNYMCRLYERLERRKWTLTADEADLLRSRMQKYAAQYLRAKNESMARELAKSS